MPKAATAATWFFFDQTLLRKTRELGFSAGLTWPSQLLTSVPAECIAQEEEIP